MLSVMAWVRLWAQHLLFYHGRGGNLSTLFLCTIVTSMTFSQYVCDGATRHSFENEMMTISGMNFTKLFFLKVYVVVRAGESYNFPNRTTS